MKFSAQIKFGNRMITIEDEAEDLRDMFRKMDAYDSLPDTGPSGEEDLKFCYRVVKNSRGADCVYYSVVCPSAGQEFKFGVLSNGTGIFPKGWERIQRGAFREGYEEEQEEPEPAPKPQPAKAQSPKADPVAGVKPNESVDLDGRAKRLVDENRVSREGGLYKVKPNDKVTYEIWKNGVGRVVCNCARFEEQGDADPEFRCEHIRAVKLFITPRPVAA